MITKIFAKLLANILENYENFANIFANFCENNQRVFFLYIYSKKANLS